MWYFSKIKKYLYFCVVGEGGCTMVHVWRQKTSWMGQFSSSNVVLGTLLRSPRWRQVPLPDEPLDWPWHCVAGRAAPEVMGNRVWLPVSSSWNDCKITM